MMNDCRETLRTGPSHGLTAGLASAFVLLSLGACSSDDNEADAYGNFEADEVVVSAEAAGRLVEFRVRQGMRLREGEVVGQIDTVQLSLQRSQLVASREAVRSRAASVRAQIAVQEKQLEVARIDRARIESLLRDQAATQKQLDDVVGQIGVLERQIQQTRTQNATILAEVEGLDAQIARLEDQIDRCTITNPIRGVVLATFAEPHEITAYGRPLYQIADLDTLDLRAYVSGAQLAGIRLGQGVDVRIDTEDEAGRSLPGKIVWIASESEFTPKLIQTKEERVNLVYALKVRVANEEGVLKIGMPGEVRFSAP